MKITTRKTKGGASLRFTAQSPQDGNALTRMVFRMAGLKKCDLCGEGIPFSAFDAHEKLCREKTEAQP